MKKNILLLAALAITATLTLNCKKGASDAEAKAAIASVNKVIADSVGPLEQSADAAAAAKIINEVTNATEAAMAKYPQLKGDIKNPELKAEMEKGGESAMKFLLLVGTLSEKYKDSAELKAAADKFAAAAAK